MRVDGDARRRPAPTTWPPSRDRHHRAHRGAERAGVLLGEEPPVGRGAEVADERLADLGRVGVGVAGPVQRHHHHEVHAGVARAPASAYGCRCAVGSVRPTRAGHGGGVGDGLRRPRRPASRGAVRARRGGRRTPRAPSATTTRTSTTSTWSTSTWRATELSRSRVGACRALCRTPGVGRDRARRARVNSTNRTVTARHMGAHDGGHGPGLTHPAARPGGTMSTTATPATPRQPRRGPHPLPLHRGDRRRRPRHRGRAAVPRLRRAS